MELFLVGSTQSSAQVFDTLKETVEKRPRLGWWRIGSHQTAKKLVLSSISCMTTRMTISISWKDQRLIQCCICNTDSRSGVLYNLASGSWLLMIQWYTMRPSTAHVSKLTELWCSQPTHHCPNQSHKEITISYFLCTADWAAWPAGAPACVCSLHAAAVRSTALVSDEKRIRGVYTRRCAIQIDNLYLYLLPVSHPTKDRRLSWPEYTVE